jgi:hypothetical protein
LGSFCSFLNNTIIYRNGRGTNFLAESPPPSPLILTYNPLGLEDIARLQEEEEEVEKEEEEDSLSVQ